MLRFLGVFGDIAVSANEEETHCAALRRQRSEVRILSGAPIFSITKLFIKSFLKHFAPIVLHEDLKNGINQEKRTQLGSALPYEGKARFSNPRISSTGVDNRLRRKTNLKRLGNTPWS